jgi:ABC-type nickel/cobalt efflux system permease component RcnA
VGPGHGKVVISTYLATHESRLMRGIALSFLSSLLQGATAIAAVGVTALVLERSMRETQHTALVLEAGSYALVALVGLFLIWRSGRLLLAREPHPAGGHGHGVHACCHGHGPSAADLEGPPSLRHFLVTVLSVGLRPCSGAILVLILAASMRLLPAGIAAVSAMSIGTGITVTALAAASVYARRSALALAGYLAEDHRNIRRALDLVGVAGGVLIALFGLVLLRASLVVADHPLL